MFSKLKVLARPMYISDLSMKAVMELLVRHYKLQTTEIVGMF